MPQVTEEQTILDPGFNSHLCGKVEGKVVTLLAWASLLDDVAGYSQPSFTFLHRLPNTQEGTSDWWPEDLTRRRSPGEARERDRVRVESFYFSTTSR